MKECKHKDQIKDVEPKTKGCEECEKTDSSWVQIRLCLTCGHVDCCDSSDGKHARKHFNETDHPIIKSIPINKDSWNWCYIDEDYIN